MKKRKAISDSTSQLKISKFFCKSAELSCAPNSNSSAHESKIASGKGPNAKRSSEKGSLSSIKDDGIGTVSVTCSKENVFDVGTVLQTSFLPQKQAIDIGDSTAHSIEKTSESLCNRSTVKDCSLETAYSSRELDCSRYDEILRIQKVVGCVSDSSSWHLTPVLGTCSPRKPIGTKLVTTLSGKGNIQLASSQERTGLPLTCLNLESSPKKLIIGPKESTQIVAEDSALPQAPLSLKDEVKVTKFAEDIIDVSLEEWDLDVSDQNVDDHVYNLQLSTLERCQVVSISRGPVENSKIIVVASTKNKEMAKVLVRGMWVSACQVCVGDVVSLQCCCRDEEKGWWVLDDCTTSHACQPTQQGSLLSKLGFLVENPDVLVAGTSVVGSLFCARKGVLSDRFRGFELAAIPPPLILPDPDAAADHVPPVIAPAEQRSSARIMLIGSLVHEVLQKSLSGGLRKPFEIGRACHDVVSGRKALWDMYAAGTELTEVRKEVMDFVPRIARFIARFVAGGGGLGGPWGHGENVDLEREWQGQIDEVRDIEENLWVPSVGLKGKVDVTVGVRQCQGPGKQRTQEKTPLKEIPLELKTGRGSHSVEHQGQVLLYCTMMSALAAAEDPSRGTVNSGLLLYLRDESLREVHASRNAVRDLILLRNDLVRHTMQGPGVVEGGESLASGQQCEANVSFTLPVLPEPIRHRRACTTCPYLTICSAHLKCDDALESMALNHPMSELAPNALKHLSRTHLDYFVHWSGLIGLERAECMQDSKDHLLWTVEPQEREKMGRCISDLRLREVRHPGGHSEDSLIVHCFVRAEGSVPLDLCPPLPSATFGVAERVLVSWRHRVAVAFGTVVSSDVDSLCISIDRDLMQRYGRCRFHVDKYEYASMTSSFCLTSLGLLLSDTWSADRLRQLLIDRKAPKFLKKLSGSVVSQCNSILKGLNKSQARAVLSALSAQDYLLIKGLPGTGKSATIVAMVQALASLGRSVLVTGHTHSSVDNVLSRLVEAGDGACVVRLGASRSVDARLLPYCESTLVANCQTPKEIEAALLSKTVVGVTCMGCGSHPLVAQRVFDVCIVDEASQVLLPITLRPIFSSRVFILVGDPEQLPPVVRSQQARKLGFEQTLFSALHSPEACVTLNLQYRMNSAITKLANDLSYGSRLVCANEQVADSVLQFPGKLDLASTYPEETWLFEALSSEMERSVVLIDTGGTSHLSGEDYYPKHFGVNSADGKDARKKYANICEAAVTSYLIKALLMGGVKATDVGVIAPYTDQVSLLRTVLQVPGGQGSSTIGCMTAVDVSTVDQFQGRDKEVVIYSFTRSGTAAVVEGSKMKDLQLLSNKARLTVAVTRAKRKLICMGDVGVLRAYGVLRDFISLVPKGSMIDLKQAGSGFSWARVFESMEL